MKLNFIDRDEELGFLEDRKVFCFDLKDIEKLMKMKR